LTKHIKTEITTKRGREQRRLFYIGSADRDLDRVPKAVKEKFVSGLTVARLGGHPPSAKPMKGLGSGVIELSEDLNGSTYRAVYIARFEEAMYVLHVFNKKSKQGIKTPQPEIDKIKKRLRDAEAHYEENFGRAIKGKG
jgi:phage-related protein